MSINDINNAAVAMNALKVRYEGFLDNADDQIAARQAAYDGIAADLRGVVNSRLLFTATILPNEPNPTNEDGGSFNKIWQAINAAPAGSCCVISLQAGSVHSFDQGLTMYDKYISIEKVGVGDNPIIQIGAFSNGNFNAVASFNPKYGGTVRINYCDLQFPTETPDPEKPWSVARSLLTYNPGCMASMAIAGSNISGGIDGVQMGLCMSYIGAGVTLGLATVSLDGPLYGIIGSGAVQLVSQSVVTLTNGAQLLAGGLVGTDTLKYGA